MLKKENIKNQKLEKKFKTMSEADNTAAAEQPQNDNPETTNTADVPEDPDQSEVELKLCKDIVAMPEGVKERFKALKVLTD